MSKKKSKKTTTTATKKGAADSTPKKQTAKTDSSKTKQSSEKATPQKSTNTAKSKTKPLANEKPAVNTQESLDKNKPSTNEEASQTKKPLTDKKSSPAQGSATDKKVSTTETTSVTEKASTEVSTDNKTSSQSGVQTVQPNTKKSGSGLSIFAILISLIALGGTGFSWYLTHIKNINSNTDLAIGVTEIGGEVTRISDSVARLKAEQAKTVSQAELTNQLLKASSSTDKQVSAIKQKQTQLSESLTKVNENLQKGANQYVIDEVSQLLKLGNNSAIFSNDAKSAIQAFTMADIQLKELANPRFSEVRRKINEEILQLKSVKQVDTESIIATLNAISNSISKLPLENEPPVTDIPAIEKDSENMTVRSELNRMWHDILHSVTIQKIDQPPKPLLAPQERYFLNQNIELQLVKAEIALLQNKQTVFNDSISEATTWLNDYFDLKNEEVQDTLGELATLKKVTLDNKLPSVAGSYDLLQSIKGGK